jgi:hypothetical protein
MVLRFPFRGKPFPAQWCTISELICDLANELIHDASWSPSNLRSCYDEVLPEPGRSHSETQFEAAFLLAFHVLKNAVGAVDCYINELCSICIDIDDNAERCAASVALVLDVVGRPLDPLDSLPREAINDVRLI